eukprot:1930068-Rhodomonas_salina.2
MPHCVERHVALHRRVVRAVDYDAALERVVDRQRRNHRPFHLLAHVQVHRVPPERALLPHRVQLYALDRLRRRRVLDPEVPRDPRTRRRLRPMHLDLPRQQHHFRVPQPAAFMTPLQVRVHRHARGSIAEIRHLRHRLALRVVGPRVARRDDDLVAGLPAPVRRRAVDNQRVLPQRVARERDRIKPDGLRR